MVRTMEGVSKGAVESKREAHTLIRWVAALLIALLLIGGGAWYVVDRFFSPLVTVTVRNRMRHSVVVELNHEGGVLTVGLLHPGERRTVRFGVSGESTYRLLVTRPGSNTKVMVGGGGYVERGYRTTETITSAGIRTDYTLP